MINMNETNERIIIPSRLIEDEKDDFNLRPNSLDDFIGQTDLKKGLKIFIDSAKRRNQPLEHTLLSGPPGLGKTTVANILSNEMGAKIITATGPSLKADDIAGILTDLNRNDIFFIDEIHRLNKVLEEMLYPAMEDFELSLTVGKKDKSRLIKIKLKRFTLVGATTNIGLLSSPFRDRFGYNARFELYSVEELAEVINRSSSILGVPITDDGRLAIAKRSRGTPRIANRLLRRVRDYAIVNNESEISKKVADIGLSILRIDKYGLDNIDREILNVIINQYGMGPVGLKTIAVSVGEEMRTIEEAYEPYLMKIGFVKRTSGGRVATDAAKKYLENIGNVFGRQNVFANQLKLIDKDDVIL